MVGVTGADVFQSSSGERKPSLSFDSERSSSSSCVRSVASSHLICTLATSISPASASTEDEVFTLGINGFLPTRSSTPPANAAAKAALGRRGSRCGSSALPSLGTGSGLPSNA